MTSRHPASLLYSMASAANSLLSFRQSGAVEFQSQPRIGQRGEPPLRHREMNREGRASMRLRIRSALDFSPGATRRPKMVVLCRSRATRRGARYCVCRKGYRWQTTPSVDGRLLNRDRAQKPLAAFPCARSPAPHGSETRAEPGDPPRRYSNRFIDSPGTQPDTEVSCRCGRSRDDGSGCGSHS